jgi:hypothetical protein
MNGWIYLLSIPRTFSEREGHDFIGHVQSSDTCFCFDRTRALVFARRIIRVNSDRASANILGRDAFASVGLPMLSRSGKKRRKFYSLTNCGMGAAVAVEGIRDLSVNFSWGGGSGRMPAQRIGCGAV